MREQQERAYDLCEIKPDEFWSYTPADMDLMLSVASNKRAEESFKTDARTAWLCMHFTLPYLKKDANVTLADFMPKWEPEKPKERTVMTDEEIESTLINFVYPTLKAAEGGNL